MINYINSALDQSVSNKEGKLKSLARNNNSGERISEFKKRFDSSKGTPVKDQKLWNTCLEMESLFVNKMFKEMRNTIHKSDWNHGGHAEEIFEDMLYDEYSLEVSKNSNLGLAKQLYEEMSKKNITS